MTTARKEQISISDTPYYHCIARCVRRAFLCGEDHFTGKSYEHRKQWIIDKLQELTGIFAIDISAYSVMSNHYHIVLRINAELAENWTTVEIVERWTMLFTGSTLVSRYMAGQCSSKAEEEKAEEIISVWKERLMDISWFMRCLNAGIARKANKEDNCKGRFWEGRFKSQALLDEQALLACMVYVDLNPIRAGIAETLEDSEYTSIQQRIADYIDNSSVADVIETKNEQDNEPLKLCSFIADNPNEIGIPYHVQDYFELTDWTGRAILEDKAGFIPSRIPGILNKLGIETETWIEIIDSFGSRFHSHVGPAENMQKICERIGKKWMHGISACKQFWYKNGCLVSSASQC